MPVAAADLAAGGAAGAAAGADADDGAGFDDGDALADAFSASSIGQINQANLA